MLRKVRIRNFRCLRDVTLSFSPLTALVGPNATGKTAILRALDPMTGLEPHEVWRHQSELVPSFEFHFDGESVQPFPVPVGHSLWNRGCRFQYQLLRLDLNRLRQPNEVSFQNRLATDGSNLANVFDSLSRERQIEVGKQLNKLVSVLTDVDARPAQGRTGATTLYFRDRWNSNLWYTPNEVSDGTMFLVAYLVLQYQDPPIQILAIEEPERGLHPFLLGELVSLLRTLTAGGKIQVVLATHSAELLEFLQPEEVRFLSRSAEDGSVRIEEAPSNAPDWKQVFDEYRHSLGSAWLSGGLGGVPGR